MTSHTCNSSFVSTPIVLLQLVPLWKCYGWVDAVSWPVTPYLGTGGRGGPSVRTPDTAAIPGPPRGTRGHSGTGRTNWSVKVRRIRDTGDGRAGEPRGRRTWPLGGWRDGKKHGKGMKCRPILSAEDSSVEMILIEPWVGEQSYLCVCVAHILEFT